MVVERLTPRKLDSQCLLLNSQQHADDFAQVFVGAFRILGIVSAVGGKK